MKKSIVLGIIDTTGNMNRLGVNLRNADMDHTYFIDHIFQLNAKLAFKCNFDSKGRVLFAGLTYNRLLFLPDDNILSASDAMKFVRGIIVYFDKSIQDSNILEETQDNGTIYRYKDQLNPLKVHQGVILRW